MSLKKALIIAEKGKGDDQFEVLFNPNAYQIDTNNKFDWQTVPGLQAPLAQYISGDATSLTMELFFDSYEDQEDVRQYTQKVTELLDVDSDLHAPPYVRFVWGSLDFKGVIEKITQKFTMFLDSGVPVRATLDVTFRSVQSMTEQYQKIPRQSADRTKERTLTDKDELWLIAAEEYEDPALWREIARANKIGNPRRLTPGQRIQIPRLE